MGFVIEEIYAGREERGSGKGSLSESSDQEDGDGACACGVSRPLGGSVLVVSLEMGGASLLVVLVR